MEKKILTALFCAMAVMLPASAAPAISHDKYDHAITCYAVESTLAQSKPFNRWKPWQRALFTTAVIGGSKEWYDSRHQDKHTASWGDIAADAIGAFGSEGTLWIIHKRW